MPTQGLGAIGSLDYTPDERKALAQRFVEHINFNFISLFLSGFY